MPIRRIRRRTRRRPTFYPSSRRKSVVCEYLYPQFSGYPLCKIQLHLQIANLPQVSVFLLLDCFIVNLRCLKRCCGVLDKLFLLAADHHRGYSILCRELVKCLAFPDGLKSHFRLEFGVVLLSACLHGAKLLVFNLGTCLKSREYYTKYMSLILTQ